MANCVGGGTRGKGGYKQNGVDGGEVGICFVSQLGASWTIRILKLGIRCNARNKHGSHLKKVILILSNIIKNVTRVTIGVVW